MNKPVAWMIRRDENITKGIGHEIQLTLMDANSPEFWAKGKVAKGYTVYPLYTHPSNACKHGVDDGACKECYLEATHPVKVNYEFNSSQVKELTDEEIMEIVKESYMPQGLDKSRYTMFARAILRQAQEK